MFAGVPLGGGEMNGLCGIIPVARGVIVPGEAASQYQFRQKQGFNFNESLFTAADLSF
jgi:hypothetical protein